MKLLVLSDSHSYCRYLETILTKEHSADIIIHLGDFASDMDTLGEYTHNKGLIRCKGNCDIHGFDFSEQHVFTVENIKILCCHGHRYRVKDGLAGLYYAGKQEKADICLFGHTHEAHNEDYDGIKLINPGAVCNGNYAVIEIKESAVTVTMKNI